MNTHKLAMELLKQEDQPVVVSIDISTCDADSDNRIFGDVVELQNNGTSTSILCDSELNHQAVRR